MEAAYRFASDTSFADYRAVLRARQRLGLLKGHGRWLRYPSLLLILLAVLWWFGGFAVPWRLYLQWDVAKWIIGLFIFIPLVDLFFDQVVGRWIFSRYAAANKPLVASVDDEGVAWSVEGWSGRIGWGAVKAAVVTPDHLFLFIGKVEAVPLSRRGPRRRRLGRLPRLRHGPPAAAAGAGMKKRGCRSSRVLQIALGR